MRLVGVALLSVALVACGGKKQEQAAEEPECEAHEDCEQGFICKDGACVERMQKPRRGETNTVTPESYKRDVERINKAHEGQVDKSLDL